MEEFEEFEAVAFAAVTLEGDLAVELAVAFVVAFDFVVLVAFVVVFEVSN